MSEIVTAGILVIGDEILSGRTKDKNIGFIAEYLTNIGIDLKEVRVVADDEADSGATERNADSNSSGYFSTGATRWRANRSGNSRIMISRFSSM